MGSSIAGHQFWAKKILFFVTPSTDSLAMYCSLSYWPSSSQSFVDPLQSVRNVLCTLAYQPLPHPVKPRKQSHSALPANIRQILPTIPSQPYLPPTTRIYPVVVSPCDSVCHPLIVPHSHIMWRRDATLAPPLLWGLATLNSGWYNSFAWLQRCPLLYSRVAWTTRNYYRSQYDLIFHPLGFPNYRP